MYFYLIGTDYKTMPFDAREELYRQRNAIIAFWAEQAPHRAAILTTCNRVEIYAFASTFSEAQMRINAFFRMFPKLSGKTSVTYGYQSIFKHMLRLACGLESQLLGEVQIFQQLETWQNQSGFAPELRLLIRKAIYQGKDIRSRCGLFILENNIATIVYSHMEKNLENTFRYNVLVLGTGKIAELFSAFRPAKARLYFAAHKNFAKAELLAQQAEGKAISLPETFEIALNADVLIGATSSPHFLLGFEDLAAIARLRTKPLYIYDLALPRDIEPKAATLPGVILHNLHTLRHLFEENNFRIKEKIRLAEYLCDQDMVAQEEEVYA